VRAENLSPASLLLANETTQGAPMAYFGSLRKQRILQNIPQPKPGKFKKQTLGT